MSYSAEESSPVAFVSEPCCICDEEFDSDLELTNHLIEHSAEEQFKLALVEKEKTDKAATPPRPHVRRRGPEFIRTNFIDEINRRKLFNVSKSCEPEVLEILSSDDEQEPDPKKPKTSFRLVSPASNKVNSNDDASNKVKLSSAAPNKVNLSNAVPNKVNLSSAAPNKGNLSNAAPNKVNLSSAAPNKVNLNNAAPNKANSTNKEAGPPFRCPACPMVLDDATLFQEHVASHDKARPYVCQICKKSFAYKSTLRQHLHLHISERAHECKVCHKKFTIKSLLRKHEETHHLPRLQEQKSS